ncbi:hypothetical protein Tco_1158014 [Tanacetum coccineum]
MNVMTPSLYGCDAWYLDDGTIIGDALVAGEILKVIIEDGPRRGLHLNVDKTKVFWPKEDPRSSELVLKRLAKSIGLVDAVTKINDSRCELLLLRACAACSKVFVEDIYGDHAVSCASIVGIKHWHNLVRDTLVDICFWSEISPGKEVDIGLGSSPLTLTGMINFVPSRAVIEVAQGKHVKYEAKCANIGYGFLLFSLSFFREHEKDAVTLLKGI